MRKVGETSNMGNLIRLLRNQFNRLNQLPWIKFCQAEGLVKGLSVGTVSASMDKVLPSRGFGKGAVCRHHISRARRWTGR